MALAKASLPSKSNGGCISSKRHRRRGLTTKSSSGRKIIRHQKITNSSRRGSRRDPFRIFANLSMTVLLLACSTLKEMPIHVSAFVQNNNLRPSAQRNIVVQSNYIKNLPDLPHRVAATLLSAKPGDKKTDDSENKSSGLRSFFRRNDKYDAKGRKDDSKDEQGSPGLTFFKGNDKNDDRKGRKDDSKDEEESSGLGSFFKRNDKNDNVKGREDNSKDEDGKGKGIPIVGRFFATDEEKEDRRQMKQKEMEEKERWKRKVKEERKRRQQEKKKQGDVSSESDQKRGNAIPNLKNYFQERQIRKDAEGLRFQVKRMEQERQKQMEKDADELREAVQQKELERKLQFPQRDKMIKLISAPVSVPKDDIVRRKIQSQKELDRKRRERQEKIREEKFKGPPTIPSSDKTKASNEGQDDANAKSSKLKRFIGAVSGVFESKEEWIVVAPKTRISPGEIVAVTVAGIDLLLVASKDGSAVHCVANSCPHLGTPLEVGTLDRLPIEPPGSQTSSSSSVDTANESVQPVQKKGFFQENDISRMLKQDGCEDCIVCPLHKTAFALESGEVRGEWCPYPPVIGKLTGAVKKQANLPVFDVRTKGKNIEVRLNTLVEINNDSPKNKKQR